MQKNNSTTQLILHVVAAGITFAYFFLYEPYELYKFWEHEGKSELEISTSVPEPRTLALSWQKHPRLAQVFMKNNLNLFSCVCITLKMLDDLGVTHELRLKLVKKLSGDFRSVCTPLRLRIKPQ